ncbi:Cys/Met metabolism pyridoxal-phosphate-dependent enzyme [Pelomyxa schiedti]|nr:Cys/Met metabolism pyridoxal-phosphate-dependent enzyme [Pelomyxa schiedti]
MVPVGFVEGCGVGLLVALVVWSTFYVVGRSWRRRNTRTPKAGPRTCEAFLTSPRAMKAALSDAKASSLKRREDPLSHTLDTTCVRGDHGFEPLLTDVAPPVHVSSVFEETDEELRCVGGRYIYSRDNQPTRSRVEGLLGSLIGGSALCFSSGSAAITCVLHALHPEKILTLNVGYPGSRAIVADYVTLMQGKVKASNKFSFDELDCHSLVYTEVPSNPTCDMVDIRAVATKVHAKRAILLVDCTFATPFLFSSLELGADIEVHSCTKFLGGHHDTLGGVLVCKDYMLYPSMARRRTHDGGVLGSFESWLLLRSLRTFAVRMQRQCSSAQIVATFLSSHPKVKAVYNPCLPSHSSHVIWKTCTTHAPPCFAFELQTAQQAQELPNKLRLVTHCTSLGGVETTIIWRYKYDQSVSQEMMRVSIGLEDPTELVADFQQALDSL